MPSGPGTDHGEDLDSAWAISSLVMGSADKCCERSPLEERWSFGEKK